MRHTRFFFLNLTLTLQHSTIHWVNLTMALVVGRTHRVFWNRATSHRFIGEWCVRLKVAKITHKVTTSHIIDSAVSHNRQYLPDPNVE